MSYVLWHEKQTALRLASDSPAVSEVLGFPDCTPASGPPSCCLPVLALVPAPELCCMPDLACCSGLPADGLAEGGSACRRLKKADRSLSAFPKSVCVLTAVLTLDGCTLLSDIPAKHCFRGLAGQERHSYLHIQYVAHTARCSKFFVPSR